MSEKAKKFWALWTEDKLRHLSAVLEIEKVAMRKGYPLATGLVSGYCRLCEKCTLNRVTCPSSNKIEIFRGRGWCKCASNSKKCWNSFYFIV